MRDRLAKLFCGLIGHSFDTVIEDLTTKFGEIELKRGPIRFDYTDYYRDEMGTNLMRDWVVFERLIREDELKEIKLATEEIEKRLSISGKRTVNIDPGYVNLSRVILASTKDYSHRIYLGREIFAEITLIYKNKKFIPVPWTYPDYRDNTEFFRKIRERFRENLC